MAGRRKGTTILKVGIVGYGYWGPNLARNFNAHPDCRLVRAADLRADRRALLAAHYPAVEVVESPDSIVDATDIDVVVIATPVSLHYPLAKAALKNGKHIWVEKPLATDSSEALELTELSLRKRLALMVDHTFLFTGAVGKMKELIDGGDLGELYYYDSVRVNLGLFQHDVNVVWDLAPHDLAIMDHLLGPCAKAVSAQGRAHFGTSLEDIAYVSVFYDNNLIAHFHFNWLSPVKIRQTLVGGARKMLVWDDLNNEEKLKIYDKGVEVASAEGRYTALPEYRLGDMHSPAIPTTEALQVAVAHFVECIHAGRQPTTDGAAGARVVSLLEAADRSLRDNGRLIEL